MEILFVNKSSILYYEYPLHEHGYWEIILNLHGSGAATIDGQSYPFSEGTIFIIPPGIRHRKTAPAGFTDGCVFLRDFTPPGEENITCLQDDASHTFRGLFQLAFETQLKNEFNAKAMINALGDVMYQLLVSWSATQRKRNAPAEAFRSILLANISNCEFDLAAEMDRTGYCSSYFRKQFKALTGDSPVNYFQRLRIEFAKKQLQQYHEVRTIKEIALLCGFTDPYYFSRVFKQLAGVSPQRYIDELGSYNIEKIAGINYE